MAGCRWATAAVGGQLGYPGHQANPSECSRPAKAIVRPHEMQAAEPRSRWQNSRTAFPLPQFRAHRPDARWYDVPVTVVKDGEHLPGLQRSPAGERSAAARRARGVMAAHSAGRIVTVVAVEISGRASAVAVALPWCWDRYGVPSCHQALLTFRGGKETRWCAWAVHDMTATDLRPGLPGMSASTGRVDGTGA